jgi:hypothetical protein
METSSIGRVLRAVRHHLGRTQADVAKHAGLSQGGLGDRLVDAALAALVDFVTGFLLRRGWQVAPQGSLAGVWLLSGDAIPLP